MKTVWVTKTYAQDSIPMPPGWRALNIPLLTVAPPSHAPEPPGLDDILVFTSGNAVRSFCSYTDKRDWPVCTVGDTTADVANMSGFKYITSAGKDVATLHDLILANPALKSNHLYYASGQDVIGDLKAGLTRIGYHIDRQVLYETHSTLEVPPLIVTAMARNQLLTVLLYSRKGARAFRTLDLRFGRVSTISISANVDENLSGLGLKSRNIAEHPTHTRMIKHLT